MQLATGVLPPCSCRVYCCHVKIPGPFTMLESLACWFVLYNSICSLDWRRPFNSEQCVHISTSLVCLPKATWNKSSTFSNHTWFYSPKVVVVNCDWNMWIRNFFCTSFCLNDASRNQVLQWHEWCYQEPGPEQQRRRREVRRGSAETSDGRAEGGSVAGVRPVEWRS